MNNVFVFTASGTDAKRHISDTIENPIPHMKVEKHFTGKELAKVKEINKKHKYYAWGALPGEGNINTWKKIQIGDHVLVYQNKTYTYYSKVLFKARNADFALDNWGKSREDETWEYMYLLEKPFKLDPPILASDLANYLPASYRGFIRLSDDRVEKIASNFGSLEGFFEKTMLRIKYKPTGLLTFWWVNQGQSYTKEKGQKYIWAPKEGKDGTKPRHWKNVELVRKKDIIFNYANGALRAISLAKEKGFDFYNEESDVWNKDGVRVDIEHFPIDSIEIGKIKLYKDSLQKVLSDKYGPFEREGDIKQGYLFEFNFEAAKVIREIYGKRFPDPIEKYFGGIEDDKTEKDDRTINLLDKRKQIILYGPPGTGKTFRTKKIAIELLK